MQKTSFKSLAEKARTIILMLALAYLDTKRVRNSSKELYMGTIQLTGTLSTPEHVGRAIIVLARS